MIVFYTPAGTSAGTIEDFSKSAALALLFFSKGKATPMPLCGMAKREESMTSPLLRWVSFMPRAKTAGFGPTDQGFGENYAPGRDPSN
jgi:hypothetical protein